MSNSKTYSRNSRLNKLLNTVVQEVQHYAESQIAHIQKLTWIGIALSAEKDINTLLERIIDQAMEFTNADAGTLYTVDNEAKCLQFKILKNKTLNTHMGGTSGAPVNLPPVPLEVDGQPNFANVSSQAALTGEIINIPDVYEAVGFDFTGPKKYDAQTGYRSKSMLVIPMKNHRDEIIGVVQLLNAVDPDSGEVVPFPKENVELIIGLTSQAAVALENAQLIHDLQELNEQLKELFEAFIETIATAIDEKSAYTGGHIRRVTELTMMIAEAVNQTTEGPFAQLQFSEDEMEELRIAAWLHDVGKIATPEYVVDKSHKLETIFNRIDLVTTRFDLIKQIKETEALQKKAQLLEQGKSDQVAELEQRLQEELQSIESDKEFIVECNTSREKMTPEKQERLNQIAAKTYFLNGVEHPYLTDDEHKNLSIVYGTLTDEERQVIQNHASVSIKMLKKLPFPEHLARVPEIAGGHHEKLDGTGYPNGLTEAELPIQARIMAIADIFEALTAKDRPYKEPMKLSKAVQILQFMCRDRHIDERIYELFIQQGLHLQYALRELNKEQIDVNVNPA